MANAGNRTGGSGRLDAGRGMSRGDWWLWLVFLVAALTLHAAIPACFPRYEYVTFGPANSDVLRIDRWTGEHQHRFIVDPGASDVMTVPRGMPLR